MDATTSSFIVAVAGVLGTLTSGLLAQRGALRSKTIEIEHLRQERQVVERRELLETRRLSYATFNQGLRQHHAALFRRHRELVDSGTDTDSRAEAEDTRRALRDAYAETQMVASDEVLRVGGGTVHLLSHIQRLLDARSQQPDASPPDAADAPGRTGGLPDADAVRTQLERASEQLYEVRQTMRRDLGVTGLPVERPDAYGVL